MSHLYKKYCYVNVNLHSQYKVGSTGVLRQLDWSDDLMDNASLYNEIHMNATKDFSSDPVKKAIDERTRAFENAMANADAAGVADCYTEDGEFMAPNGPAVKGKNAIEKTIAEYIDQGFTQYKATTTIVYGDEGVVGVQTEYNLSQEDGKNKDFGKSIQLWKEEKGTWKIFRDCFNSNLPEQPQ